MKCLVTGSRNASPIAIISAYFTALLLISDKEYILVGDASGIDEAVIDACNSQNYADVTVYGCYGKVKHRSLYGKNLPLPMHPLKRDNVMARDCDECFAIWNGVSRGTKHTFKECQKLGKPTHIRKFPKEEA